jgi:hypothetical protein
VRRHHQERECDGRTQAPCRRDWCHWNPPEVRSDPSFLAPVSIGRSLRGLYRSYVKTAFGGGLPPGCVAPPSSIAGLLSCRGLPVRRRAPKSASHTDLCSHYSRTLCGGTTVARSARLGRPMIRGFCWEADRRVGRTADRRDHGP